MKMKFWIKLRKWKPILLWTLLCEAVGFLVFLLTRNGVKWFEANAVKPPLMPPGWLFGVVWAILYGVMGISAGRIWVRSDPEKRSWELNLFVVQLVLNFFWSLIFFNARAFGFAAIWIVALWIAVLVMILRFHKVDKIAAWLQIPYLAWLTLASYLSFGVWLLNG